MAAAAVAARTAPTPTAVVPRRTQTDYFFSERELPRMATNFHEFLVRIKSFCIFAP